jgi:hypothetical protein
VLDCFQGFGALRCADSSEIHPKASRPLAASGITTTPNQKSKHPKEQSQPERTPERQMPPRSTQPGQHPLKTASMLLSPPAAILFRTSTGFQLSQTRQRPSPSKTSSSILLPFILLILPLLLLLLPPPIPSIRPSIEGKEALIDNWKATACCVEGREDSGDAALQHQISSRLSVTVSPENSQEKRRKASTAIV